MDNKKMFDLLIKSFDEQLSPDETKQLEEALSESDDLRKEKEHLLKLRRVLSSQQYEFKPFFETRVMNRILKLKSGKVFELDFTKNLSTVFKRVAISGIAAIIILLITFYISEGSFSLDTLTGVETFSDDSLISYLLLEY
jgi:hypothetical protein